jgi:hypothetical protein
MMILWGNHIKMLGWYLGDARGIYDTHPTLVWISNHVVIANHVCGLKLWR